jgi:hypothetical protein
MVGASSRTQLWADADTVASGEIRFVIWGKSFHSPSCKRPSLSAARRHPEVSILVPGFSAMAAGTTDSLRNDGVISLSEVTANHAIRR